MLGIKTNTGRSQLDVLQSVMLESLSYIEGHHSCIKFWALVLHDRVCDVLCGHVLCNDVWWICHSLFDQLTDPTFCSLFNTLVHGMFCEGEGITLAVHLMRGKNLTDKQIMGLMEAGCIHHRFTLQQLTSHYTHNHHYPSPTTTPHHHHSPSHSFPSHPHSRGVHGQQH